MGDSIIKNEIYFCELDSHAGDGDFGMSVAKGFNQLLLNWIDAVLQKVGGYFIEMDKTELQLQRVIGYIMDNLQKDISREEVANHVFLNPDYLDRLFKKQYNMSVSKYILQERMKLAKQLLAETNLSISTIGTQLGYNNLSNFSSAFKKIVKQNPAEFRKNKY